MHRPFPPPRKRRAHRCSRPPRTSLGAVTIWGSRREAASSLPFPYPYPRVSCQQPGHQPRWHSQAGTATRRLRSKQAVTAWLRSGPSGCCRPPPTPARVPSEGRWGQGGHLHPSTAHGAEVISPPPLSKTALFPFTAVIKSVEKQHLPPPPSPALRAKMHPSIRT